MSDAQFERFMKDLRDGTRTLQIKAPNLNKTKLNVANNIKVAKELGYDFFQRLRLKDPATGLPYMTSEKYLILALPLRRQQQHLIKKMSVPTDNDSRDDLTGQPTGKSKGSSISNPETQTLYALGCDRSIEELLKPRGGDHVSYVAMNKSIHETGGVSLDQIAKLGGTVKSNDALANFLTAQHLRNNVNKDTA